MVCIHYVGAEAFDIVLYTGHALARLKYPVLIVDLSDSGALKSAIHHGMDIDSRKEAVSYRDINYIRRIPDQYELQKFADGAVLVVFGFNYSYIPNLRPACINVVVNAFTHVLDKVNFLISNCIPDNIDLRLLVRDIITPDDLEIIKSRINFTIKPDCINYLYLDFKDYENAIRCQRLQAVKLGRASRRMKKLILSEVKYINSQLCPSERISKSRMILLAGKEKA